MRVLTILEATVVNAVAKNVLDFHRWVTQCNAPIALSAVTFERPASQPRPERGFVETAQAQGLPVDVVIEKRTFDLSVIPALRAAAQRCRPDVVVSHNVKSHFLTRLSGLPRSQPWLAFHHGYTAPDLKMRLYNRLDRWSLAGADKIVAVCGPFAEQVLRAGVSPERVIVQHNAIDRPSPPTAAAIQQVRTRLGIAPNQRLLIAIGRLSSEKGHLDLIDAYAAFRTLKPAIASKLVLLGDGPERSNLEARIHSAQLSGHVVLAGHIQDVQPYYSASDLVIIPSHSEGSPYVLLEAMAAGVPVVATAVGGIPEIAVNEKTALLVPPHNPSALAAAIARMIDNPELAQELSRNAQADVSSRFSPNVYVDEMLRVYSGLIARRAR